jgi:hypothetical protein
LHGEKDLAIADAMMKGTKMKKFAVLSVLILGLLAALAAAPAFADSTLYSNGTGNHTSSGPLIGGPAIVGPYQVSDSFTLSQSSTVTGVTLDIALYGGDTLASLDWSIGTSAFDNSIGAGTVDTFSPIIFDGFNGAIGSHFQDFYTESFSIPDRPLGAGTYWLTLANGVGGGGVFWQENDGPSAAYANYPFYNYYGNVASETFQILGSEDSTATPEPSSFLLLGSGLAGLAGLLKRKLRA